MWIVYNRMPTQVVGAEELDLREILKKGDKIVYGSVYAISPVRNRDSDTLPRITGTVVSVSRYHAIVRLPSGRMDTANWYDISKIGKRAASMQAYVALLDKQRKLKQPARHR